MFNSERDNGGILLGAAIVGASYFMGHKRGYVHGYNDGYSECENEYAARLSRAREKYKKQIKKARQSKDDD